MTRDRPSRNETSDIGSHRQPSVRVRTARQRTTSSTLWLQRQLNDPYVIEAKRSGYRSRAAFKLLQLDKRFHLFSRGTRVVDLGSAPGGWVQVAVERGATEVVGIDYLDMDPIAGATILKMDFLDPDAPERLKAVLRGTPNVVLSDMAAPTTGHGPTDHLRVVALAEAAYSFAFEVLASNGSFVAKVFQGGSEKDLLNQLKRDFSAVRHVKPPASRADSAEIYVVGTGFRGGKKDP